MALEKTIAKMIEEHRAAGTLNEASIKMLPPAVGGGPLRFPGKVASGPDGLIAIADSGHNRVIISRANEAGDGAEVQAVAGTGARGAEDGGFSDATFTDPQGMLFLDE